MVRSLQSAHGGACDGGNLFVRKLFEIAHAEDSTLLGWESGYGKGQHALCRVTVEPGVGIYHALGLGIQRHEAQRRPNLLLAKEAQGLVGGNPP